jgi:hypothetical protein
VKVLPPAPRFIVTKKTLPPRDKDGHFLPTQPKPPEPSTASLEDTIASSADKKKLARVLLARAYKGDAKAVEFVSEILERRVVPPQDQQYNTTLLCEGELRLLLFLLQRASGKVTSDSDLVSLCRALIPQEPDEDEQPESEPEPQPVIPVPATPRPVPQASAASPPVREKPLPMPSTGNRRRSLSSYFSSPSNPGDYDDEYSRCHGATDDFEEKPN